MNYDFHTLRGDVFGGLTATVVVLPFALAFGVASGLGAAAGLYGAIAVGFFASVFGGTRSLISGPTGPMAVAMAVIVTTHATNLTEALTVVVMGGLLQVLLGLLRIGRFVAYTPYVVISGFMSGIGIIIMLIQSLPFLGAPTAPGGPMGWRVARGGRQCQQQRFCHRRGYARCGRALAAPTDAIFARSPDGANGRHLAGRSMVARRAGHWAGADRPAEFSVGAAFRQFFGECA